MITTLLKQLPTIFTQVKNPEPALLPTINAAITALEATGGKIICSLASLPTWGPGRLQMKEHIKGEAPDGERKLFSVDHPDWKKAASKLAESGIGIDFFIASPGGAFLDLTTIGRCPNVSVNP